MMQNDSHFPVANCDNSLVQIIARRATPLLGKAVVAAGLLSGSTAQAADIFVDETCSLIEAIQSANTNISYGACETSYGADTIILQPGQDFTLTAVHNSVDGDNGLPVIFTEITIQGNGSTIRRDFTAPAFRLLNVLPAGVLALNDVTLTGGSAATHGGAIFCTGRCTLTNSIVTGNSADFNGGGVVTGSSEPGNVRTADYLILQNTQVSNNSADRNGGGVFIEADSPFLISSSHITGNTAEFLGGGIHVDGLDTDSNGNHVTRTITQSTLSGNLAGTGGAIHIRVRSSLDDDGVSIDRSTIHNNTATNTGGGIDFLGNDLNGEVPFLTIRNSTISGNTVGFDSSRTGGIENRGGGQTISITNSTITNNDGVGINNSSDQANGITLAHSIVSGNGGYDVEDNYNGATFTSNGYNLIGDGSASNAFFGSDITGVTNPKLGPLTDNGGFTFSHRPNLFGFPSGSQAVDRSNEIFCIGETDQRGKTRPLDGNNNGTRSCDIGAVEAGNSNLDSDSDGINDRLDAEPRTASNVCDTPVDTVALEAFETGEITQCGAATSINVGANNTAQKGWRVDLFSPQVTIPTGFRVTRGSILSIKNIDPSTPP